MELFRDRVRAVVASVPRGRVITYGEAARRAGKKGAARAVGMIMNKNRDTFVPCHRVIRSDKTIGGFNRGTKRKMELLKKEGIHWDKRGKILEQHII